MEKNYRVLAINPGSTSTKVGVYEGYEMLYEGTVRHSQEELAKFAAIHDQKDMRMELVEELVEENGYKLSEMDAFVGRGGIVKPLKSGVYTINEKLMDDLKNLPSAQRHASMLGGVIARAYGDKYGKPSFIVDPVTVDERDEVATVTGLPMIKRGCIFHCLNQKSVCRYHCRLNGMKYEEHNFVVAHLGAMAAVLKGEVDAVIITGGIAYSKMLTEYLVEHTKFIAPVAVYPGEGELSALAAGAVRVLSGEEQPKEYLG